MTGRETRALPRPPGPRGLPLLGNLPAYRRDAAQFLLRTQRDYGPVSRLAMGPYEFTLATSPTAVQRVLFHNRHNYCRGQLYRQFELVMGRGLLTMDEEEWRPHRRVMQPAFLKTALAGYFEAVRTRTLDLIRRWDDHARMGSPVNLMEECVRLASAIIMDILFSFEIDDQAQQIKTVVDESIDIMFPHGTINEMLPSWLPTPRNRRVRRNRRALLELADQVVDQSSVRGERTLDTLLTEVQSRAETRWSRTELRDEVLTIYLAGHETTATGIAWSLLATAWDGAIRARLEAEVDSVLGGAEPAYGDLEDLPYTRAVIDETLRLYPPIWLFPRDVVQEDQLDGYRVDPGTSILLSPLLSQRDPHFWPDPTTFDPTRFLERESRPVQGTYFPFGLGARQCIGNTVALMEMQTVLAMLTQRYRLDVPDLPEHGDTLVSLRPLGSTVVRVRRRDGAHR